MTQRRVAPSVSDARNIGRILQEGEISKAYHLIVYRPPRLIYSDAGVFVFCIERLLAERADNKLELWTNKKNSIKIESALGCQMYFADSYCA